MNAATFRRIAALVALTIGSFSVAPTAHANPALHVRAAVAGPALLPQRPAYRPVVVTRAVRPSLQHIWVEGDWHWNGITWAWQPGYWSLQRTFAQAPVVVTRRVVAPTPVRTVRTVVPRTQTVITRPQVVRSQPVRSTTRRVSTTTRRTVRR